VDWKEFEKQAMTHKKEELIDFLMKKMARNKRELGKKIEMEQREYKVVDSYVSFLRSIIPSSFAEDDDEDLQLPEEERERRKAGMKHFKANEGRKKQILVLQEEIKQKQKKIDLIKEPKDECFNKKKEAQSKITPALVKKVYKYFENNSDPVPCHLFEIFIGALRGTQKASREDIELYLKNQKGLITSMNKLEENKVNREHAKFYADVLKKLKDPIKEKEYGKFIPFYVWMDNVIRIIKYSIEEKHLKEDLDQKEATIVKLHHEIDRTQIILDHLGIDPYERDHLQDLEEFWSEHNAKIQEQEERDRSKLSSWDDEHIQAVSQKSKKHGEEEKKVPTRAEYPTYDPEAERVQEAKKMQTKKEEKAKKASPAKKGAKAKVSSEESKDDGEASESETPSESGEDASYADESRSQSYSQSKDVSRDSDEDSG
jgi:hypothetical protein